LNTVELGGKTEASCQLTFSSSLRRLLFLVFIFFLLLGWWHNQANVISAPRGHWALKPQLALMAT